VEVNVQRLGNRLAANESGYPREIATGNSGSVIALRVTGIVAEHSDWPILVPKRKLCQLGINNPFRLGAQLGFLGGRVADSANLPVRPMDAAVGGNFLHRGSAPTIVRGRLRGCD